jgi:hypothetical protein
MRHSAESMLVVKYLHEYESMFETALAHASAVLFAKKP